MDAVVLVVMYAAYLAVLWRFPPQGEESLADARRLGARVLTPATPIGSGGQYAILPR